MILKLFGCRGYAYNLIVNKLGLSVNHIHMLNDHIPSGSGILGDLKFSKLHILEKNTYYLCKIISKNKQILTFVIYNNYIYVAWSKKPCKSKQKWNLVNCKKTKKKCINMGMKRKTVTKISEKLKELITEPSMKILNELFGYDKSYIQPQNDINEILKKYKNADIYVYS